MSLTSERYTPAAQRERDTDLDAINEKLARQFQCAPADLSLGADHNMRDTLLITGILGGKDVGKSTLINALAQTTVTEDEAEAGAGTVVPRVYVHADSLERLRERFDARGNMRPPPRLPFDIEWVTHEIELIRQSVLIDLPDFDSEFPEHVRRVHDIVPFLDRVIWLMTPRKVADRVWADFSREVPKAGPNILFVLNKMDEVLAEDLGSDSASHQIPNGRANSLGNTIWDQQHRWFGEQLERVGADVPQDRMFLIASGYPEPQAFLQRVAELWNEPDVTRASAMRDTLLAIGSRIESELGRLRKQVLVDIEADEVSILKLGNRQEERRLGVQRLRRYYEFDHWLQLVSDACDLESQQASVQTRFGPEFHRQWIQWMLEQLPGEAEQAHRLFAWRAQRWPLLRTLYFPLHRLIAVVGRRLVPRATLGPDSSSKWDDQIHEDLERRTQAFLDQHRSEQATLIQRFNLENRFPDPKSLADGFVHRVTEFAHLLDQRMAETLQTSSRKPGVIAKSMVFIVLLWFPLVQPLAEGTLQMLSGDQTLTTLAGLYKLVWALGAAQLLRGLAIVLLIYALALTLMYARCVRDVRRCRSQSLGEAVASTAAIDLEAEVERMTLAHMVLPVLRPLAEVKRDLEALGNQLNKATANAARG